MLLWLQLTTTKRATYRARYDYKGGLEDLQKAQWYLNKLIEVYKEKHK